MENISVKDFFHYYIKSQKKPSKKHDRNVSKLQTPDHNVIDKLADCHVDDKKPDRKVKEKLADCHVNGEKPDRNIDKKLADCRDVDDKHICDTSCSNKSSDSCKEEYHEGSEDEGPAEDRSADSGSNDEESDSNRSDDVGFDDNESSVSAPVWFFF